MLDILNFLQTYHDAILILAGLFGFLTYVFGRLIRDEMPPMNDGSRESDFAIGIMFFINIIYQPLILMLLVYGLSHFIPAALNEATSQNRIMEIYTSMWFIIDFGILIILSILLWLIYNEENTFILRLDFYEKLEERWKNRTIDITSYGWTQIGFVLYILLLVLHSLKLTFSLIDELLIIASGIVLLLMFFNTASLQGHRFPKPKILVYTKTNKGKPFEAFFIRWEKDCARIVPKKSSAYLIPRSDIFKIEYPRRELVQPLKLNEIFTRARIFGECFRKCMEKSVKKEMPKT